MAVILEEFFPFLYFQQTSQRNRINVERESSKQFFKTLVLRMLTDKTVSNILVLRRFDFYGWPIENKGMKRKTAATLWLINVSVIKVT